MRVSSGGIFGVTVTPFTADGIRVAQDGVVAGVEQLVAAGIKQVIPCGNTGEFFALDQGERCRIVELTVQAASKRATVIVGVGGSLTDVAGQAAHAAKVGADGLMAHHPPHPYVTEDGLVAYYRSVADSGLPVFPYLRSPTLSEDGLRRVLDIPEVAGVKFAYNDLPAFARAVQIGQQRPDVAWICGTAERWAPFYWRAGAVGFTSGLVNVTATYSLAMLNALQIDDRPKTMELWDVIRPFEELRARDHDGYNVAVIKEALRQLGRSAGPVRPPASEVDPVTRRTIGKILGAWGLNP